MAGTKTHCSWILISACSCDPYYIADVMLGVKTSANGGPVTDPINSPPYNDKYFNGIWTGDCKFLRSVLVLICPPWDLPSRFILRFSQMQGWSCRFWCRILKIIKTVAWLRSLWSIGLVWGFDHYKSASKQIRGWCDNLLFAEVRKFMIF